jgi:glucuronate isomerase
MGFMDDKYLLQTDSAIELYSHIKELPIIDLHSHADIEEIILNKRWNDIWEVEAATDHYVWELMRKRGIDEEKITGKEKNREKWYALAGIFPEFAGNPTYEWIHLDLKRRFKIDMQISMNTADKIWEKTKEKLKREKMRPQNVLKDMNVEILCTTDDPTSSLKYHKKAKKEIDTPKILPTWRPDKAMKIENNLWKDFILELGEKTKEDTSQLANLLKALKKTHNYFDKHGCISSDHGMYEPYTHPVEEDKVNNIYKRAYQGKKLSVNEIINYKAFLMLKFGKWNMEKGWLTQFHLGAFRDYSDKLYKMVGPDSGGDISIQNIDFVHNLKNFLNEFDGSLEIVLYCLDPSHYPTIATIARAFPNVSIGAPWWFNDSPFGIEMQLKYICTVDLLSNYAGMVSDSRKLISYGSRIEVFRRTLCNVIGEMVEKGQIPEDIAKQMVINISYNRPKQLIKNKNK